MKNVPWRLYLAFIWTSLAREGAGGGGGDHYKSPFPRRKQSVGSDMLQEALQIQFLLLVFYFTLFHLKLRSQRFVSSFLLIYVCFTYISIYYYPFLCGVMECRGWAKRRRNGNE